MPQGDSRTSRLATAAFGVLLLATLGAFLLANRLKASEPEIEVIRRDSSFSPNGDGRNETDTILFRMKTSGRASVDVVDADGVRVRRLEEGRRIRKGARDRVTWDGRDDDGRVAPDGRYRLRFILDGRSLLAPRPFAVDTVPPRPAVRVDADTPIIRPGGTAGFSVRGAEGNEAPRFRVVRTDVTPPRVVRSIAGVPGTTAYEWDGRTDAGSPAAAGVYLIAVTAFDRAGNAGRQPRLPLTSPPGPVAGRPGVTVRSLAVQPPVRAVRAGGLANVRVDARGRAFRWTLQRLGRRKPVASGRRPAGRTDLLVRVPRGRSGLHLLRVETRDAETTVPVAVRARDRVGPLVVLPMISWLGRDPVDTTKDGVPDVFSRAAAVRFPRLFAYSGGVPPGFFRQIAPLVSDLEERGLRYDLATDLDLAFTDEPVAADQRGVLMAGEPTWVSRDLAGRLNRYVRGGGRLALFGPRALRATVSLGQGVLARPSPLAPVDALGGRLAPVRASSATLSVLQEDQDLGLLEGFSGQLTGFDRVEELQAPGRAAKVTTSVGEEDPALRPVISAARLGKGLVMRVGLPQWGERLASGDAPVVQLTANVVDLLRGRRPRARTARG